MVVDPYGALGTSATYYLYINNSLIGSSSGWVAPTSPSASTPFTFGASGAPSDYLSASLNGWGIWAVPLTAAQISLLYNGGSGINVI
jgi:hypothetical protein